MQTFFGTDTLVYEICDLGIVTLCDEATVILTIEEDTTPTNVAPIAEDDTFTLMENSDLSISSIFFNDSDADNNLDSTYLDINNVSIISATQNGTVTVENGELIYTPNADFFGTDTLVYEICDLGMPIFCDEATVIFTIEEDTTPTNVAPIAEDDMFTLTENTDVIITSIFDNDSDADNNCLLYTSPSPRD